LQCFTCFFYGSSLMPAAYGPSLLYQGYGESHWICILQAL
jgi:hypothetical protein